MSITLSVTNGVGTPTFSRIGFMNSVAGKILAVWTAGIREFADNPAVKTMVLNGAGRAFCAGMDLKNASDDGDDMPRSHEIDLVTAIGSLVLSVDAGGPEPGSQRQPSRPPKRR